MKKYQVTFLAGVIGSLCGSAAFATALTETADVTIYFSGSTAFQAGVVNAVKAVCDTTTVETYNDKATSGSNARTFFCRSKGVTGLSDGTKLQVRFSGGSKVIGDNQFSSALGGSILGISPVVYSQKLNFLAVSPSIASSCTASTSSALTWSCDDAVAGVLSPFVPQLGMTDLPPEAFVLQNAPVATGGVGSDAIAKLKISPGPIQIFNPVVTKSLRDALQDAQIKSGKLAATCSSTRELGACTPSIKSTDVPRVFGGAVTKWSEIDSSLDANKLVYVVRREVGSGTQATLNLVGMSSVYGNVSKAYPCVSGSLPAVLNPSNVTVTATGGAMVTGMNNAETAGNWAMGFIDTTKNGAGADTAPTASFRYVLIDDVSPTLTNVANGKYKFIAQATLNRLSAFPGSASELAVVDAITRALGDPTVIAKGNTGTTYKQNFGQSGHMVVGSTSCTSDADCLANPVTAFRFASNPADNPAGWCNAPKNSW